MVCGSPYRKIAFSEQSGLGQKNTSVYQWKCYQKIGRIFLHGSLKSLLRKCGLFFKDLPYGMMAKQDCLQMFAVYVKQKNYEGQSASFEVQSRHLITEDNFLPLRQSLFHFSGAGKFCLAYRLRQLISDVKTDVRTLNFRSDVILHHHEKHRMTLHILPTLVRKCIMSKMKEITVDI